MIGGEEEENFDAKDNCEDLRSFDFEEQSRGGGRIGE